MGNRKLKWTPEEEEALVAGIAKHGAGKWKTILVDFEFAHTLSKRSNVDLKDKWRNVGPTLPGKGKATATCASATPKTKDPSSSSPVFVSKVDSIDKPPQSPQEVKYAPRHSEMILDAISTIKDWDGSDSGAILGFIKKKYEVSQSFRRSLSAKLRKLVSQGTLEKIEKRYKIKSAALSTTTTTATPKQEDLRSKSSQNCGLTVSAEAIEDAANAAAQKIAEAENKSFVAAEAVKESERVSQMAEDADAVLMNLKQIFERWDDKDNTSLESCCEIISIV